MHKVSRAMSDHMLAQKLLDVFLLSGILQEPAHLTSC